MNNSIQSLTKRGIYHDAFDYAYIFIDNEIMPPTYRPLHLKRFIEEACQLINEIREFERPPPPRRIETILKGLIGCQEEKSLMFNSRLRLALNLLIEKSRDHYFDILTR